MDYFQDATTQRFTFVSYASGVSDTTFAVLRFKGLEAISTPYEFEVMLVSGDPDLDMSAILQSQAVFTIHRDVGDDVAYNGILAEFDQLHAYNEHYFYRAKLVPKIWWLMQTQHNQVFLDKTVPEIIEGALVDGGMDSLDYDLSALEGTYNPVDYVCQYGESHFNFVSRWLEREGVYYYFYHDVDGDKLVLSDSSFSHEPFQQGADLVYSPKTGMEHGHLDEIIVNFTCRQKQLPHRIVLKDHNPERPSLEMAVHADVDPDGRGETFLYGEHYSTPEEGERLITFRAEELLCTKQAFHGDSTVPFLTPGFKFNMSQHYRSAFNQEYMVTSVTHEGDQTNLLKTSVIGSLSEDAEINIYSNSFTAIPADRQYRHPRTADRPRISGTLHGKIDGEQDSPYAQLDEQGRYKVKLPFDINDEHIDGKASARVRMMQPYAGEGKGMQFPLTKGTEVLLTFIDGNPDRPVIAGAVSTESSPSPVNAKNQSESVIRSAGNNRIRMEDRAGSERIVMESPSSNSWVRIGAPNDPPALNGESPFYHTEGGAWDDDPGAVKSDATPMTAQYVYLASELDDPAPTNYLGSALDRGIYYAIYEDGTDKAIRKIIAYDPADLASLPDADSHFQAEGVRLMSSGVFWAEAKGRYGNYINNYPADDVDAASRVTEPSKKPASSKYLLKQLKDFSVKGLRPHSLSGWDSNQNAYDTMSKVMNHAHVQVSSFDTVNIQEGNIYDFGGYWNYNLGNSYEEAHILQSANVNQKASLKKRHKKNANGAQVFGDMLDTAGPGWTKLNWIASKNIDSSIPVYEDEGSTEWHSDYVWTTKEFGNSYDIRNGSAISITNGATLDVTYTGHTQVELAMRDGDNPAAYMRKTFEGAGDETKIETVEKTWSLQNPEKPSFESTITQYGKGNSSINTIERDAMHGVFMNEKRETITGLRRDVYEFDYANNSSAKITAASSASFTMDMSASVSANINVALSLSLTQNAVDVDIKSNGISVEIDVWAMDQKVTFPNGSVEARHGVFHAKIEPKIVIKKDGTLVVKKGDIDLSNKNVELKGVTLSITG